jgi:hypothetical protein
MKNWSIIILVIFLPFLSAETISQQASGYILFGKKLVTDSIAYAAACTKQGICKLNNTTSTDHEGSMIQFNTTPIKSSKDSFTITFTVNLENLNKEQPEQYGYFSTTTIPYTFGADFEFPVWLMDSLGYHEYEPISLKALWHLGKPPKADASNNITMILCGFVISSTSQMTSTKEFAKKKGKVLTVAQVKKAKAKK